MTKLRFISFPLLTVVAKMWLNYTIAATLAEQNSSWPCQMSVPFSTVKGVRSCRIVRDTTHHGVWEGGSDGHLFREWIGEIRNDVAFEH